MHGRERERQEPWLLIKERDDDARPAADYSIVDALPNSVLSQRAVVEAPKSTARATTSSKSASARGAPSKTATSGTAKNQLRRPHLRRLHLRETASAKTATAETATAETVSSKTSSLKTAAAKSAAAKTPPASDTTSGRASPARPATGAAGKRSSSRRASAASTAEASSATAPSATTAGAPTKTRSSRAAAKKAPVAALALPAGAVKAALPDTLAPELATLVAEAPAGGDWSYEIKFDGYRVLARVDRGEVRLVHPQRQRLDREADRHRRRDRPTRHGLGLARRRDRRARRARRPDFAALQNAFDAGGAQIRYFVFDLPYYGGHDLREVAARRAARAARQPARRRADGIVRFSEDFESDARRDPAQSPAGCTSKA